MDVMVYPIPLYQINKIAKLVLSIPRIIWINFKLLSLKQACYLPIIAPYDVDIRVSARGSF